jgi:hypothetical protein
VLLVMDGTTPDPTAFAYALNLCKRTNAQLDILGVIECRREEVDSPSSRERIFHDRQQLSGLEDRLREKGILHRISVVPGDTNEEILNYTKDHRDIATVILDAPAGREASGKAKKKTRLVRRIAQYLSVPVVTVLPRQPAAAEH